MPVLTTDQKGVLAIAKEISTALGGRIILESEVGKGSRFELVLPVR